MKQVLFTIPGLGVPVHGFALLVVLGFFLGVLLARRRSLQEGLDPDLIDDLAPWVLLGGLIGARLLFVAEYWGEKVATLGAVFRVWEGGLVFYGGLFGAVVAVLLVRAARAFPLLATLDALTPALALGIAIGRVGCFLNGCCYGDPCPIPWLAVRFPPHSPPWLAEQAQGIIPAAARASLPLHPTQLYESAFHATALVVLLLLERAGLFPGQRIKLYFIAYLAYRFASEWLRPEPILGLGLNYAAYEAEVYRGALAALPRGQTEAASALGLTRLQMLRHVLLPQALRNALPAMTNDFIALLKDSSLVSVITVVELTKRMTIASVEVRSWLVPGLTCAALYFAMSFPLARLARRLERRLARDPDPRAA